MTTVELKEATDSLAEYSLERAADPLIVLRDGKPIAALIGLAEDTDLESLSLSTNPDFIALIERSRASLKRGRGISAAEMRKRVDEMNRREKGVR